MNTFRFINSGLKTPYPAKVKAAGIDCMLLFQIQMMIY